MTLASNIAVFAYMIYKVIKTKRNPYLGELYIDLYKYMKIKASSERALRYLKEIVAG